MNSFKTLLMVQLIYFMKLCEKRLITKEGVVMHILGLCDNEKRDISLSVIIF